MKTLLLAIGLLLVNISVFATSQTKATDDKPARVFLLGDAQVMQDDYHPKQWYYHLDGTLDFRTDDKDWTHYDHEWVSGFGGVGLWHQGLKFESWDALGAHYIDADTDVLWPCVFDWSGFGNGAAVYYFGGVPAFTNIGGWSIWQKIGNEHCNVSDTCPPPAAWDHINWWYDVAAGRIHGAVEETYTRKADTIWHVQTGGRAIPFLLNPPSVFQFGGYASKILDKRALPPFNGAATLPIPSENITICGKPLGADHLMYQTLSDDVEVDVTPKVAGEDFYTFSVGASKHTLTSHTWHPALTDPDPARSQVGVGEEVNVYLDPPLAMTFPETPWWSVSGGGIDTVEGSITKFTAASNACTAEVKVHVRDIVLSKDFGVKEPKYESALKDGSQPPDVFTPGIAGVSMYLITTVNPTDVSFYRVKAAEVSGPATNVTGYMLNFSDRLWHDPSGKGTSYGVWAGYADNNTREVIDYCKGSVKKLPNGYYPGGFDWVIPVAWGVGGGPTVIHGYMSRTQSFRLTDNVGTLTVTKMGASETRTP